MTRKLAYRRRRPLQYEFEIISQRLRLSAINLWSAEDGSKANLAGWFCMLHSPVRNRPTVGQLARAHTFRFLTMVATWALVFGAFVYHPEWIRAWLRFVTSVIETAADQVPEPWGARPEVVVRELGGIIWIQIASAIVLLRLIIWVPFHFWRLGRERRQP